MWSMLQAPGLAGVALFAACAVAAATAVANANTNAIGDVPVSALARAVTPDGTDLFVQHVRLGANAATGWHTHPGPALVAVAKGSITYQNAEAKACKSVTYVAGEGFVDRGFGHVHRAIAGADGVDFYVVYLLPPGSEAHVIPASPPAECDS